MSEERVRAIELGDLVDGSVSGPACENKKGGLWHCTTHNETFQNQFSKDSHIGRGKHVLAWLCFEHGPEVP